MSTSSDKQRVVRALMGIKNTDKDEVRLTDVTTHGETEDAVLPQLSVAADLLDESHEEEE